MKGGFGRWPSKQVYFVDAPAAKRRGMNADYGQPATSNLQLVPDFGEQIFPTVYQKYEIMQLVKSGSCDMRLGYV